MRESGSKQEGERRFVEVAVAVVFDGGHERLLICKRKADTVLGGYWEFPGGKRDVGETEAACARREVLEETGIEVRVVRKLAVIEHDYPHARVRLHPFLCELVSGTVALLAVEAAEWILPAEVTGYRFPEANGELVRAAARGFGALAAE